MSERSWMSRAVVPALVALAMGGAAWQWRGIVRGAGALAPKAAASEPVRAPPLHSTVVRAEGRLAARAGAMVTVGADFPGIVRAVRFEERGAVKKGDVLAEIAADETRAAVGEAQARVREAEVDIAFFESELGKAERLLASNAVPKDLLDRALHDRDAARARRGSALATAGRLSATLAKSRVTAPFDAVVLERLVEPGAVVASGAGVATLFDPARVRVEAEVDEYDTGRIEVGAAVAVLAEGYEHPWRGRVEEIPDVVGPRRLRPQDPGRPSDPRILLVKIALEGATPLKLGQRVEVDIAAR